MTIFLYVLLHLSPFFFAIAAIDAPPRRRTLSLSPPSNLEHPNSLTSVSTGEKGGSSAKDKAALEESPCIRSVLVSPRRHGRGYAKNAIALVHSVRNRGSREREK